MITNYVWSANSILKQVLVKGTIDKIQTHTADLRGVHRATCGPWITLPATSGRRNRDGRRMMSNITYNISN